MDIQSDGARLVLNGAFDVRSTGDVRKAIYEHLAAREEDVVVDLTHVDSVDVTAHKVLAAAKRRARPSHAAVRLATPETRPARAGHAIRSEHE